MELTEKQKNCPYCHYPWEKIPIENLEDDDEAFYFERYETNGTHKLMKTIKVLRNDDVAPWPIAVNHRPKHCEMCGRPLNEDEEYERK